MEHRDWYRRYLPHCDRPGLIQAVTFCLADAWGDREPSAWQQLSPAERARVRHEHLDVGYGACWLRFPEVGELVQAAIQHRHARQYELLAWVVMPNHVHLVFQELEGWPLSTVIQRLKGFTGHGANRLLGRHGPFWQDGYWDRYIRSERHLETVMKYVIENPVASGLVESPELWPWSSAAWNSMEADQTVRAPGDLAQEPDTGSPERRLRITSLNPFPA